MATPMSKENNNFLRLAGLLIRIAPRAVRQRFDYEFHPEKLQQFLGKNRRIIDELKTEKRVITQAQFDILYPRDSSELSSDMLDVSLMTSLLRHFTDISIQDALPSDQLHNTGADISRIKFYRNYIVHSNSGTVTEKEFTEIWNCVEEAILRLDPDLKLEIDALMSSPLTNLGDLTDNIRLEKELAKTNQILYATNQKLEELEIGYNNIAEIRNATLNEWKDTDKKYVPTSATAFILKSLKHKRGVIITGSSGCGKSSVAQHVALKLEGEGFEVILCDDPNDIIKYLRTGKKQVFVTDDVCGKFALNQHIADVWERKNSALDKLRVSCNQNDNISKSVSKFIFTCREYIYTHKAFPKLSWFLLVQCSFSIKYKLTQGEMRKIALSYVTENTVNDIENVCLYDFFPLLCSLYSKKMHPDPRWFNHPVDVIEKEISEMKIKSEPSFLSLSLLVLKNNKCRKAELRSGELKQLLENVCRESDIESVVSFVSIQKCFDRFIGIYISESDHSYKAIHDKMFDIISTAIAPSIMDCLIEYVDITFLANRTQLVSLGKSSLPFVIHIPERLEKMYLQRQYKEVIKGKYWEVFGSLQTENEDYRNQLLSYLGKKDTSQPISYVPDEDGTTPLFVSSSLGYVDFVQYFIVKCHNDRNAKDKKGRCSFYVACENGHTATVKYLLTHCVDTTIKDEDGLSALHAACRSGHTDIVKLLIDVGMNINDTEKTGIPPLHLACRMGQYDTVRLLLDMNKSISKTIVDTTIKDTDGLSALHSACFGGHTDIVKMLIDVGLNINDKTKYGMTPFWMACKMGCLNTVQFLISKHDNSSQFIIDFTLTDYEYGHSALNAACFSGNLKLVKLLIDVGMDINHLSKKGTTPFFLACFLGHYDIVSVFLDLNDKISNSNVKLTVKDSAGWTALHVACIKGHTEVVTKLIDIGMNVNEATNDGSTPLFLACREGRSDTVEFLLDLNDQCSNSHVNLIVKDSEGRTALHAACHNGHTEVVMKLFHAGMNVNEATNDGSTPLLLACREGRCDTVKFLLDFNSVTSNSHVDLTIKDSEGRTPLHEACHNGHTEVVKNLIDAGMNVNDTTNNGSTPVLLACGKGRCDIVKFLIDLNDKTLNSRVDLTIKDVEGRTHLQAACYYGHTEIVKLLIDGGMNVNETTNNGVTPLFLACWQGQYETVRFLLGLNSKLSNLRVDIMIKDLKGWTAFHAACYNGQTEVVKILIDAGMDVNDTTHNGSTSLILAGCKGRYDIVSFLLDLNSITSNSHVDLIVKDSEGRTALHAACNNGNTEIVKKLIHAGMNVNEATNDGSTPLFLACREGRCDTVKFLLDLNSVTSNSHVDLTEKDSEGRTPLHVACHYGHTEVAMKLIHAGMNVNDTTNDGSTPLFLACSKGRCDTVEYLIDLNCQTLNSCVDCMIKTFEGWTAFHAACYNGHTEVANILIDAGMDLNDTTSKGYTPLFLACSYGHCNIVKFLLHLNRRIDLMIKDFKGRTALHVACYSGNTEIVQLLIDTGMNVNDTANTGSTPLYLASEKGHCDTVKFLLDFNSQTSIIDIKVKCADGWTALHAACHNGHTNVVKILIEAGMNVNDTTKYGCTPLFLACREGRNDTVKFLLDLNGQTLNSRVNCVIKHCAGWTALHSACYKGHTDVVKILIDAGINMNITTDEGVTPLSFALVAGHHDIVKCLLNVNEVQHHIMQCFKDLQSYIEHAKKDGQK